MDAKAEPKTGRRRFLSPTFVRAMLAGHSALGLAFAWLIYVVCLTGTLSVFAHDFQRWEQPDGPTIGGSVAPEAVSAAVRAAYSQALADNAARDLFILGPNSSSPRLLVSYSDHESGTEGNWLGDAEGRLVARVSAPWTEFLTDLHINLHLPRTWGMFLVGLTGVALLSSLISGLLSHPRIFRDAFALRWGGSRRLQEADLHNRLGVWGLPFHIVVSLTGALLGLSTLIVGVLALAAYDGDSGKAFSVLLGPTAGADETAAPVPDVAAMIRHVQREKLDAGFVSVFIQHIGKAGQVTHLGMRTPGHIVLSNSYFFDSSGKPLGDAGFEEGSIGQQLLGAISPLHFGWFGGIWGKLLYGVLGFALTVIAYNGVVIWLARRRDKGRPAPTWEKVWAAAAWSQPLALSLAAVTALVLGDRGILIAYLASTLASFALCAISPHALAIARALRLLTASVLMAIVVTHIVLWAQTTTDSFVWIIDAAIALCATAMLWGLAAAIRNQDAIDIAEKIDI